MPTHVTSCIVCGKDCYCSNDAHALGCGGSGQLAGAGGCFNPPYIEFCSLACFNELCQLMIKAKDNYFRCLASDQ